MRSLDWIAFGIAGVSGMVGHMAIIRASQMANAAKVVPFTYTQIIWMTGLGFLVFGQWPDQWTMVGMVVVAASGLYLWYREYTLRKKNG
ncbi:MAG: DMT family transporter [Ahrensia sp.]|nr:DMT family transporter [Ahrensia sp.]